MQYDIAIVGGGPGGYVAAIKAAQMGKKTCIIEKDKLGGTCLNIGCIPTKVMLKSAETLKELKNADAFGVIDVDTSKAKLDLEKVQVRKKNIVDQLVAGVGGLLRKNKVDVLVGQGKLLDKNTIQVGDRQVYAKNIIIATGSSSKNLPIKIDSKAKVLTSTQALDLTELPQNITIIGGGVIGIEFAYFLGSLGTKVTILEFLDRILPMIDAEIGQEVTKQLKNMGISIVTGAKVSEIKRDQVIFEKDGQLMEVQADKVLMSVGRIPNVKGLNLEQVGIQTKNGAILTNEFMATNIEGIYAIGDVNGKSMLAHTASKEGIVAVNNICGNKMEMDYSTIPNGIYIQPEIASVGLTEEEARQKYGQIKVGKFPLIANGKAKVSGDERGLIKLIAETKYNEIVGAHIYSSRATDMISELTLAMDLECTAEEIAMAVHPHPTISEAINEACHAVLGRPIHF